MGAWPGAGTLWQSPSWFTSGTPTGCVDGRGRVCLHASICVYGHERPAPVDPAHTQKTKIRLGLPPDCCHRCPCVHDEVRCRHACSVPCKTQDMFSADPPTGEHHSCSYCGDLDRFASLLYPYSLGGRPYWYQSPVYLFTEIRGTGRTKSFACAGEGSMAPTLA